MMKRLNSLTKSTISLWKNMIAFTAAVHALLVIIPDDENDDGFQYRLSDEIRERLT